MRALSHSPYASLQMLKSTSNCRRRSTAFLVRFVEYWNTLQDFRRFSSFYEDFPEEVGESFSPSFQLAETSLHHEQFHLDMLLTFVYAGFTGPLRSFLPLYIIFIIKWKASSSTLEARAYDGCKTLHQLIGEDVTLFAYDAKDAKAANDGQDEVLLDERTTACRS